MHDARRLSLKPRRLLVSVLIAVSLATVGVVVRPMGWSPICNTITPDNDPFLWLIWGCWIDPPPKDPRA